MIAERGQEDWDSEFGRFPRLFQGHESSPASPGRRMTFTQKMTIYLGKRRVDLMHLGRAHTAGDIVAWVPDGSVMLTGDIVEYHSACYCGDAHFSDWPATLDAITAYPPARHRARPRRRAGRRAPRSTRPSTITRDFVERTYRPVAQVARRGGSLKEAWDAVRAACDPKFAGYAIYEHCLPFNVARAYDEALGIDTPRIWTAERDLAMWEALQG